MAGVQQAVIMAAGRGVRLGALGRLIPKGLIELGGVTLVEQSIRRLRASGITRIVIVTGHLAEQYAPVRDAHAGVVELVHNAGYERGGSFASLLCALPHMAEDCLLLESDIVYERRALDTLQALALRDCILTSGPTQAGDEVWVSTDRPGADGVLAGMAKDASRLAGTHIVGELSGVSRLSIDTLRALAAAREFLYRDRDSCDYEDALVHVAPQTGIRCVRVDDLVWAEMDTVEMVERVQREVWPRLQQAG